jgi:uncharacterized membrane protein
LFSVDGYRMFIFYHRHYEIKVMMMLSSSIVAALFVVLTALPIFVLERRIIQIVDCFMCMVVFVLRITYGQVVLLRTVLNSVA